MRITWEAEVAVTDRERRERERETKRENKEESEESDDGMGFSLFDQKFFCNSFYKFFKD